MKKALNSLISIFIIAVGAALFAFAVAAFIRPINAPIGGVSGIAQMISHIFGWPMGLLIIILNIPLFLISFRELGSRFIAGSLYGMVLSSVLIDLLDDRIPPLTDNPLLSALYGGVLCGTGLALVYWHGATTGGTDIVIKLMRRRMEHMSFGRINLILNVVIILVAAVVFRSIESALFAMVVQYVSSSVMDAILHGVDNASMALIITSDPQKMSEVINNEMKRGVTGLMGRGMYTNDDKTVLMAAIRRHELGALKRIVREQDSSSFVIMLNANEVLGKGFKHMG
ncbi:MAG: YitT family protein [Oscillospiraceae bacterium]|nr:YitT family protein [Oscillospiraceae bacterium]